MCNEDGFEDPAFTAERGEDAPSSDRVRELSDEAERLRDSGDLSQQRFEEIWLEAARHAGERDHLLEILQEIASKHLLDVPD
jgi:hypothetical protein